MGFAALLRLVAPYLIAVALVGAALFGAYERGAAVTDAQWLVKWNAQGKALAEAQAKAERIQRDEEQRRQAAIDEVRDYAQKQIQQATADAAAAHAAADGLRKQSQRFAARWGAGCSDPSTAKRSTAAIAPGLVFADVLAGADDTAGELAAAYDAARAAGRACEQAYDAVRGGQR